MIYLNFEADPSLYDRALNHYIEKTPVDQHPGIIQTGEEHSKNRSSVHYMARNPVFPTIWGMNMYRPKGRISKYLKQNPGFNNNSVLPQPDGTGKLHALPVPKEVLKKLVSTIGCFPMFWACWYWERHDTVEGIVLAPINQLETEKDTGLFKYVSYCHWGAPTCVKKWAFYHEPSEYYYLKTHPTVPMYLLAYPVELRPDYYKRTPFVKLPKAFFHKSNSDVNNTSSKPNQLVPDIARPVYGLFYDSIGTLMYVRRRYNEFRAEDDCPNLMNATCDRASVFFNKYGEHTPSNIEADTICPLAGLNPIDSFSN